MRTKTIARLRRGILSGSLALALAAPAQQDQAQPAQQPAADQQAAPAAAPAAQAAPADQQQAPPPKSNETAPVVTEQSPRPPPDANIQPVPGTPEEYVIQRGDTLWDLSQKFLNNPWYWPKIWSNNPYIENPHWIYPGNKLKIIPGEGGAQAPAQVQAQPEQQAEPGVDATAQNAPAEEAAAEPVNENNVTPPATPDLDVVNKNSREGNAALSSVSVSGKLAFAPPPVIAVKASGLVSPDEMANAGTLDASFEEKEMLSTYDTAYVRFKTEVPVKPGDKLLAFRPVGDIVDPVSHRKLATQTVTSAILKVLSVQGQQATVQVERAYDEVNRGDLVRPWVTQDKRIAPKANTADVSGVIVQAVNPGTTTLGESNEVFIDKGSADGVQEGNTFAVVRHGDGLNERAVTDVYNTGSKSLAKASDQPPENVGLLLVVDTSDHISTAVVVKSVRELIPGDTVEMHPAGAGGG